MIRLWLFAGGLAAIAGLALWLQHRAIEDERRDRALRDATEQIEGTKDARKSAGTVPADDDGLLRWLRGVAAE